MVQITFRAIHRLLISSLSISAIDDWCCNQWKSNQNRICLESVIASARTCSWSWPLELHIHHSSLNSPRVGQTSWPLVCDSGNVFGMRSSLLLWAPLIVSGRYAPFERWGGAGSGMDRLRMRSWQFFAGWSCQRVFGFLLFCSEFMTRIARLQKNAPIWRSSFASFASTPLRVCCCYWTSTSPHNDHHDRYKTNRIRLQLHTNSIESIVDRSSKRQFSSYSLSLLLLIVHVLYLHSTLIRSTIMLSSYLDSLIDWLALPDSLQTELQPSICPAKAVHSVYLFTARIPRHLIILSVVRSLVPYCLSIAAALALLRLSTWLGSPQSTHYSALYIIKCVLYRRSLSYRVQVDKQIYRWIYR